MHALLHILIQTTTTKPKSKGSSSSSVITLLFFVVIIGGVYLLFLRPRQQRMRQQQAARGELAIGEPVLTAGGIHGTLVALDDEVAEVEVAPGVVMTFLKRAVTARPGTTPTTSSGIVDDEWEIPSRIGTDQADESANGVADEPADHQQSTDSSKPQDGVVAHDDDDAGDGSPGDASPGDASPGDGSPGEAGSGDQNDRLS